MNKRELAAYIEETYHCRPYQPWEGSPENEVFRHATNHKWFALSFPVDRMKLGLAGEGRIDIVNLKCDPALAGSLAQEAGIFPAYHMNKTHWISVALDGSVPDELLRYLLDMSYGLTKKSVGGPKQK